VTGTTASVSAAQPVLVARSPLLLKQFKVENSIYEKKVSPQVSTVESKFRKYASGTLSSDEMNILQF
jgi:hypothetical protein